MSQCSFHLLNADLDVSDLFFCSRCIFSISRRVAYLENYKESDERVPRVQLALPFEAISFSRYQLCSLKTCGVLGGKGVNEVLE